MTVTRSRHDGRAIHFPPPGFLRGQDKVHEAPSQAELHDFAHRVSSKALPMFVAALMKASKRKRYEPRWLALNHARIELARLCLERIIAEGGVAVPAPLELHLCCAYP